MTEGGEQTIVVHAFKGESKNNLKRPALAIASTEYRRNATALVVNEEKNSESDLLDVPDNDKFEVHNVRCSPKNDSNSVESCQVRKSLCPCY